MCLPAIDLTSIYNARQMQRASWESEFQAQCENIAEVLAHSIAYEILTDFNKIARNPFETMLTTTHFLVRNIDLDITTRNTADKISKLYAPLRAPRPLNKWLEVFTQETINEYNSDKQYFRDMMAKIGFSVERKLKNIFTNLAEQPESTSLEYRVRWCKEAQNSTNNDVFECEKMTLHVALGFNEAKLKRSIEQ